VYPSGVWLASVFLVLWKSYLLSWRTKLEKLLCLKCFGRIALANFSHCSTVKFDATMIVACLNLTNLNDDEAVTVFAPPHDVRMFWIFHHTVYFAAVSRKTCATAPALGMSPLTYKACAPMIFKVSMSVHLWTRTKRTYKVAGGVHSLGGGCR
jgi:hypothetical protein